MKTTLMMAAGTLAAVSFANPSIDSNSVSISQDAGTRVVTVSYELSGGAAIVTAEFLTNGVSIGDANVKGLVGDINRIVRKTGCTFTWQPRNSWPNHVVTGGNFAVRLKAWSLDAPPDWMIIDLAASRTAERDTITFYTSSNALPEVIGSDSYKLSKMLLRKIPANGVRWLMGSQPSEHAYDASHELQHYVTLTNDYYMPIYEITQKQHSYFYTAPNCKFKGDKRPMDDRSYNSIRGGTGDGINWPATAHSVKADSIIDKLRTYTMLPGFDLPTSAEWEYACRAGCPTAFYDGSTLPNNVYSSDDLNRLAWNGSNSEVDSVKQTHEVGGKVPNAFGLYDMLGNVAEWTLDWDTTYASAEDLIAPTGPTSCTSGKRVIRGGCWYHDARSNRIGSYALIAAPGSSSGNDYYHGYRPVVPASFE